MFTRNGDRRMLKCAIVDDEIHAIAILEDYIAMVPELELIKTTSDPIEMMNFLQQNSVDIIFLDINMPKLTGIDLLRIIRSTNEKISTVLTTAYSEYAVQGFDLEVTDYLLKPFSFERFHRSLQKIYRLRNEETVNDRSNGEYIFVKVDTKDKSVKINFNEILYIEGLKNYVCIYTVQEKVITLLTMISLEKTLPANQFLRVHRSYIIPTSRIKKIDGNRVYFTDVKGIIPVGTTYKARVANFLFNKSLK